MVLIISILVGATVLVSTLRLRVPRTTNIDDLGWMSEQWLADHRAAHPS